MELKALAEDIKNLNYVVMRNWEKMPPEGDIDFFVHPKDLESLAAACQKHLGDAKWYDIRTVGDNYYPKAIEERLLERESQVRFGEWFVPDAELHFVTLYYHMRVHKGDTRYMDKLDEIFFKEFPPVRPEDEGVGFHAFSAD